MGVREKIFEDLNKIENTKTLNEIYSFIQHLNTNNESTEIANATAVMKLRGCVNSEDAKEMATIVSNEFGNIEGDW